ncbi:hypothetical protein [Flagellimonas sp.]|uniref:hypothetical protein n=1 Tax=Flagellimonas sp. TaxID=2058762 RepID=UPI003BB02694
MIIAYDLFGHDNLSFMWPNSVPANLERCPCDDLVLNNEKAVSSDFKIKKKLDVSYTYDGYLIVSERFKEFVQTEKITDVNFYGLPASPGYYLFTAKNILEFDALRRRVKFSKPCEVCNQSLEVIGSSPVCLKQNEVIKRGIFRSDVEFGEKNNKFPIIIIGIDTHSKLMASGMTGIDSHEILDKYDWEK